MGAHAPWQRPESPVASGQHEEKEDIMATQELTSRGWSSWLDQWWHPFLWITLTPIVTVPLSYILFELLAGVHEPQEVRLPDCEGCWFVTYEYSEVVPTAIAFTLPRLLNLAPLVWILSPDHRARSAGVVAGMLGALRLSIPLVVLMLSFDRVTNPDGMSYFHFKQGWAPSPYLVSPYLEVWFFGFLAWLGSLVVWALFGRVSRRSTFGKEAV
jgi:hypothetical protein